MSAHDSWLHFTGEDVDGPEETDYCPHGYMYGFGCASCDPVLSCTIYEPEPDDELPFENEFGPDYYPASIAKAEGTTEP